MRWFLSLLLALTLLRPVQPTETVQIFFGPKAADHRDGLLRNLLKFLDTAKTTLHASVHEVDMILVAEKFAERAAAGVEVHLVIEADWWNAPKRRKVIKS